MSRHSIVAEYETYDNADERSVEAAKQRAVRRLVKAIPHDATVKSATITVDGEVIAQEVWTEWV